MESRWPEVGSTKGGLSGSDTSAMGQSLKTSPRRLLKSGVLNSPRLVREVSDGEAWTGIEIAMGSGGYGIPIVVGSGVGNKMLRGCGTLRVGGKDGSG
jgi:hypothetical protein